MTPLVVGFDLDMTLLDSRAGFSAVLAALSAETGVALDIEALTANLGAPLEHMLAPYFPPDEVADLVDRFRALYPSLAIDPATALPGAREALDAVRRHGGRAVVITGKYTPNAQLHLDALQLVTDGLVGKVWGNGKAPVLVEHGASIYVGDHVHDVTGAKAAGAVSVSVLTGGCTEAELRDAGTDVVLSSLEEFPAWLDGHVLTTRLAALDADLRARGSVLVAFSGGADSAFLLAAAVRALGHENVAAATAYSDSLPVSERDPARKFAESLGVRVLTPQTHEMDREGYRANGGDRCYFCKAELVETLAPIAASLKLGFVATGTNADDAVAGFRPGIRAADERGAITPLRDAGLTKAQVREASRRWGLPTWDKPAAACLSSRIAYGLEVSSHRLARVETAEADVRAVLFRAGTDVRDLRVRDLGERASIEIDRDALADVGGDPYLETAVLAAAIAAGFPAAELDPRGFRSGSLNALLRADPV